MFFALSVAKPVTPADPKKWIQSMEAWKYYPQEQSRLDTSLLPASRGCNEDCSKTIDQMRQIHFQKSIRFQKCWI